MTLLSQLLKKIGDPAKIKKAESKVSLKDLAVQFNDIQHLTESISSATCTIPSNSQKPTEDKANASCALNEKIEQVIVDGNVKLLEKILDEEVVSQGGNIASIVYESGATILHRAAGLSQNTDILELLLTKYHLEVNTEDDLCASPLFHAIGKNNINTATFLLSKGADPNRRDKYEQFPLYIAVHHRCWEMVDNLILFGSSIDFKGAKGKTVLHHAAETGDLEATKTLVEKYNASLEQRDRNNETVLFYAANNLQLLEYLLQYYATENGHEKLVKFLRICNSRGFNVLHHCVEAGLSKSLLTIIANVEKKYVAQLLNDKSLRYEMTLLHLAVATEHKDLLHIFAMSEEVDGNVQDANGDTGLHIACRQMKVDVISILMVHGEYRTDLKNKQGLTCKKIAKKMGIDLSNCKKKITEAEQADEDHRFSFDLTNAEGKRGSLSLPSPAESLHIDWGSGLEVGVSSIDSEHHTLVNIINELIHNLGNADTIKNWTISYLIGQLLEYTEYHFRNEEDLMAKYSYPEQYATKHKQDHKDFTSKVNDVHKAFAKGQMKSLDMQLLQYLIQWLTKHILRTDKYLADFINKSEQSSATTVNTEQFAPASFQQSTLQ